MAGEKNFNIKNGLSVGGVEVIDSNGDIVAAGVGTAVNEAIADKIGGIISELVVQLQHTTMVQTQ